MVGPRRRRFLPAVELLLAGGRSAGEASNDPLVLRRWMLEDSRWTIGVGASLLVPVDVTVPAKLSKFRRHRRSHSQRPQAAGREWAEGGEEVARVMPLINAPITSGSEKIFETPI